MSRLLPSRGPQNRFPETPLTPFDGDFLASVQTVSQSAAPGLLGFGASRPTQVTSLRMSN